MASLWLYEKLTRFVGVAVELQRAELSSIEKKEVDVVLALPSTERAADKLLISEGLINLVGECTAPVCILCR